MAKTTILHSSIFICIEKWFQMFVLGEESAILVPSKSPKIFTPFVRFDFICSSIFVQCLKIFALDCFFL